MRLLKWNGVIIGAALAVASVLAAVPANAAATIYNWSFTDQSSTVVGSGTLEMTDNIVVTSMKGTLYGQKIQFYQNKPKPWTSPIPNNLNIQTSNPVPGESQVVGVPNSGGANDGYDDIYDFNNGVTYFGGLLISTGKGPSLTLYFITRDSQNYDINTPTDFFTFPPNGAYGSNNGTFTVTAAQ
jgi:hypothetical protein